MSDVFVDYAYDLPDPSMLNDLRADAVSTYQKRNQMINRLRLHVNGENKINVPEDVSFAVRKVHSYMLRAAINEQSSRFRSYPQFQVTPLLNSRGNVSGEAEKQASRMEMWLDRALYWMDRGDAPTYPRIYEDVITYCMAGVRVENVFQSAWSPLVVGDDGMDDLARMKLDGKDYTKAKNAIKRDKFPFRSVYCQPDSLYPIYESGEHPPLVLEFEQRYLRDVLNNPRYAGSGFASSVNGRMVSPREKVTVMHLGNNRFHAYYALTPGNTSYGPERWPTGTELADQSVGNPVLLYAYEHHLGQPVYTFYYGAFGTWHGNTTSLEGRLNAIVDLCDDADQLQSQAATAIRSAAWPRFVHKIDPNMRDSTETKPKAAQVRDGENVAIWKDESIAPLMAGVDIGALQWLYSETRQRFQEIMGSGAVYGQHQEGASTGYHEQVLLTQTQRLQALYEMGVSRGAVNHAHKLFRYINQMDESVPACVVLPDANDKMKRYAEYIEVGPKDLNPYPVLDARVISPDLGDMSRNIQTAHRLLTPVGPENMPLASRSTVQREILGFQNPDAEDRAIKVAMEEAAMRADPVVQDMRRKAFFKVVLANEMPANPSEEQVMAADPALGGALEMASQFGMQPPMNTPMEMDPATGQPLGVAPPAPNVAGMQGVGGGVPAGMAQPEQVIGNVDMRMQG